MTVAIANVDITTDTFLDLVTKVNASATAMSNVVVTTNSGTTVGHANVNGSVSATVIYGTNISGGFYGSPNTAIFTSNVSFATGNNSFGAIGNIHATGANSSHKLVMANTSSSRFLYTSLLDEIKLVDGANSGVDSDLLDGQEGTWYADIAARLGFTPVNRANANVVSKLTIANTTPTIELVGTANTITVTNTDNKFKVTGTKTVAVDGSELVSGGATWASATPTIIAQFPKASFRAATISVAATNGLANAYTSTQLSVIHDGANSLITEYAIMHTNTSFGSFTSNTDATNVRVYFEPTSAAGSCKTFTTLLPT